MTEEKPKLGKLARYVSRLVYDGIRICTPEEAQRYRKISKQIRERDNAEHVCSWIPLNAATGASVCSGCGRLLMPNGAA